MRNKAYHGGAFWDGINPDFSQLDNASKIINADVLDAWFDPSPKVIKKISEFLPFAIMTSPPTHCEGLVQAISEHRKIPESNILVGGGSSDLMFAFFPNMLSRRDKVVILDPMYGEYAHIFENVVDFKLFRHKLSADKDFVINYDLLDKTISTKSPQMVVIVNPNSPTGKYWDGSNILKLAKSHTKTIFVIDETYIDYIGKEKSLEQETSTYRNLVVIKSMSKVYALSGARVGYIAAHPCVIEKISPFIPPWSVSLIGQIAGIEALNDSDYYRAKYIETGLLREEMVNSLKTKPIKIFNSSANFFLLQLNNKSAQKIVAELRKQNIYIRNCDSMSSQFHDDFIRIAVKDKESNNIVVEALNNLL